MTPQNSSEEIERDNYRHRHIDIDIEDKGKERKGKRERRFYVPKSFEAVFEKLETILKREGSNLSKWARQQAADYVRLHEPGNPQQPIERYLREKDAKPYVAPRKCAIVECPNNAVGTAIFKPDKTEWAFCKYHLREKEFQPNWKVTDKKIGE